MIKKLLGFVYGVIFGAANIVPGVSAGAMMAAFDCYDAVIDALSLDFNSIRKNRGFFIPFGIGTIFGIIGFMFGAAYLLANFPFAAYMFFIGLTLGSLPTVYRTATKTEKFRPAFLFPLLLAFTVLLTMNITQSDQTEPYSLKQSVHPDNSEVTIVSFTNLSNQSISEWIIEFEAGAVSAVGGASLICNEGAFDFISAAFGNKVDDQPNAFTAADIGVKKDENYKELKPNENVTFTYVSSKGKNLALDPQISYKLNANMFLIILFGCFFAAAAMVIPGVTGTFIMTFFGIYTTVTSAFKNFDFMILILTGVGIVCGIILGAKFIKLLLKKYRTIVYSAIIGFMLGSIFIIFPYEHLTFNIQLAFGIATLVLGGAIALTVSMEKKSNEDLKSTSKNL